MPQITAGLDEELDDDALALARRWTLRMPISRVRSVTVTSMMFMMPMPPTSREMAAMPPRHHALLHGHSWFCQRVGGALSLYTWPVAVLIVR